MLTWSRVGIEWGWGSIWGLRVVLGVPPDSTLIFFKAAAADDDVVALTACTPNDSAMCLFA